MKTRKVRNFWGNLLPKRFQSMQNEATKSHQLRLFLGEEFILWAEEYYGNPRNMNARIPRKALSDSFFQYMPEQRRWTSVTIFKKKIIKFCEWKGYIFNPQKHDAITGLCLFFDVYGLPDPDDKECGIEYFTVGIPSATKAMPLGQGLSAMETKCKYCNR